MADKTKKRPDNVPGKYYVDDDCISCDACVCSAPNNFTLEPTEGKASVIKQPSTPQEEEACIEAMDGCPVMAIGNDGEA